MRFVLGLFLIAAGIVLGVYVGFWVCFVGGIMDLIAQVRAPEISGISVAFAVFKICFASCFGYVAAYCGIVPGAAILQDV